jgi:hypothetical protein
LWFSASWSMDEDQKKVSFLYCNFVIECTDGMYISSNQFLLSHLCPRKIRSFHVQVCFFQMVQRQAYE